MRRGVLRSTEWGDLVMVASQRRQPQPGALMQVRVAEASGARSVTTVVATGMDAGRGIVVGLPVPYQRGPAAVVRTNRAVARAVHDLIVSEARPLVETDEDADAYGRLVGAYVGRMVGTAVACGANPAGAVAAACPLLWDYTAALAQSGVTLVEQSNEGISALVEVATGALGVAAHAAAGRRGP